jgi:hypothetical protein
MPNAQSSPKPGVAKATKVIEELSSFPAVAADNVSRIHRNFALQKKKG